MSRFFLSLLFLLGQWLFFRFDNKSRSISTSRKIKKPFFSLSTRKRWKPADLWKCFFLSTPIYIKVYQNNLIFSSRRNIFCSHHFILTRIKRIVGDGVRGEIMIRDDTAGRERKTSFHYERKIPLLARYFRRKCEGEVKADNFRFTREKLYFYGIIFFTFIFGLLFPLKMEKRFIFTSVR